MKTLKAARLFRENKETSDSDIHWSHVGPLHKRAYFNLIALIGYAHHRGDHPPFHLYNTYGWQGIPMSQNNFRTIPAAKRAARAWIQKWLAECEDKPVVWTMLETGVHFVGHVNGMQMANYYYCPEPRENYHKGFRVWFGGTYYVTEFSNPEEARLAVSDTYRNWIAHARKSLI